MTIDHTLSWELARVGGLVAYALLSASVALGLLLSLKVTSDRWPRFITNELHRFVTLVALIFTGIHTVAVLLDPFTGFTVGEVLVPFAAHYRPLWIAMGIVTAYVLVAVWASEYVRNRVGYAWWRRFHYLAFIAFWLGTLHGVGAGSDTGQPWALLMYAAAAGLITVLTAWRFVRALPNRAGDVGAFASGAALLGIAAFALLGPAQAGWNATANNGNGNGASAAWVAAHPSPAASAAPATSFSADLTASVVGDETLRGTFDGGTPETDGTFQLLLDEEAATLELSMDGGWSCQGEAALIGPGELEATCGDTQGSHVDVIVSGLRRQGDALMGTLAVAPASD